MYIDERKHIGKINNKTSRYYKCDAKEYKDDLERVSSEFNYLALDNTNMFTSTHLLEQNTWLLAQKEELTTMSETLSRGRVILVNPGIKGIGREQRYIHLYIVLGEFKETFIGVPITNKAKNQNNEYYLRNFYEVDLINPGGKKPFSQYRCNKPSVADIRNISGLDKRRIIKDKKYAPIEYLNAISYKIRESLAVIQE